jgi:hypothetical protein
MNFKLVKIVLLLALTTQISHAAWVFNAISKDSSSLMSEVMSYVFAISLESSIYIFTVAGKKKTAGAFAVISTSLNLLYYWFTIGFTFQFMAMLIISPIIPITIWYYAELINDRKFKNLTKGK